MMRIHSGCTKVVLGFTTVNGAGRHLVNSSYIDYNLILCLDHQTGATKFRPWRWEL
ncbi:hypothetical protein [Spirosoma daeguense]